MLNKTFSFIGCILSIIIIHTSSFAQIIDSPTEQLLPTAREILADEFEKKGDSFRENLPYFYKWDILSDFRLGTPFPFYILHMKTLHKMKSIENIKEALEFRVWHIPIYLGSVEEEPRTQFHLRKNEEDEWRFSGMGGDPKHMLEAMESWPAEEGYRHARVKLDSMRLTLIMIEQYGKIYFYYYEKDGERKFHLIMNEDGSWPLFSLEHLKSLLDQGKVPSRRRRGLD